MIFDLSNSKLCKQIDCLCIVTVEMWQTYVFSFMTRSTLLLTLS